MVDNAGLGPAYAYGSPDIPPKTAACSSSRRSDQLTYYYLLLSRFDTIRQGGPTRTSADVSVPRPRTHDDRTGRVFPDHLITSLSQ
jgi:hypothetical protein